MKDDEQLCRIIFERAHDLSGSIGPKSVFESRLAKSTTPARSAVAKRAEWISKVASLHISHVNTTYEWYRLMAEHFRPLHHDTEYPIGAMKEICTLVATEDAPAPSATANPEEIHEEDIYMADDHLAPRRSSRLVQIVSPANGKTVPSTSADDYFAPTGSITSLGQAQLSEAQRRLEDLALQVHETEALLTDAQIEATNQTVAIFDRHDHSRLWFTEEGRLRCWLDIAQRFVGRVEVTKAFEGMEVDGDEDGV